MLQLQMAVGCRLRCSGQLRAVLTVFDSGVALAKLLRYRSAKVSVTGSFRSITVASSCEHARATVSKHSM